MKILYEDKTGEYSYIMEYKLDIDARVFSMDRSEFWGVTADSSNTVLCKQFLGTNIMEECLKKINDRIWVEMGADTVLLNDI